MIRPSSKSLQARAGFTLLEVLLASAIGVMLLGGLYVAVDVQFRQTHAARRANEQNSVARGALARVSADINDALAPVLSTVVTNSAATAVSAPSTAGATAAAAPATTASTTPPAAGGSSGSAGSSTTAAGGSTAAANVVVFNTGIQGDAQNIIITSCRVPRENLTPDALVNGTQTFGTSDLRRVIYWMPGGGDAGLARYEMKTATSTDEAAYCVLPPAIPDEMSYIFAPEIKSVQFSYFDGTNWQDTWDSTLPNTTTVNSDQVTAQGPPVAIAIVIGVQTDNPDQQDITPKGNLGGGNGLKMYRRVIAIPTANGATINAAAAPTGQ